VRTGTVGCLWRASSETDWISIVGVNAWHGDFEGGPAFVVKPNQTGFERTGLIVVGETPWQVKQQ
jgi:hypothetical protein